VEHHDLDRGFVQQLRRPGDPDKDLAGIRFEVDGDEDLVQE
jgi:hypothetical protein